MKPEHIRKKQDAVIRRPKATPKRPFLIEYKTKRDSTWRVKNRFATKGQRDRAWSEMKKQERIYTEKEKIRPLNVDIGGETVNLMGYFKDFWTYRKRDLRA